MSKKHTKKKSGKKDPYAGREAAKYANPIVSREFILNTLESCGAPQSFEALQRTLNIHKEDDVEALRRRLGAMVRDGQLIRNRRGSYGLASKMDLKAGRVVGHPDGFGFLIPDDGSDDLFLSAKQMRSLLHGDRALACVAGVDRRGKKEGALVDVLSRANEEVIGRFYRERGMGYVAPDNKRISQDILIHPDNQQHAEEGQIVMAAILEQPNKRSAPTGKITEVLGDHMAPGMEIDIAIRAHALPLKWPKGLQKELDKIGGEVDPDVVTTRKDLRDLPLVTIDGEDARDFDDAVYCEPHGKGWRLIVAIADVSHYVEPSTKLDAAAQERSTSVYFPGRVIPMLPELLSNGLCSLNPDVDRLCMVCEMFFSHTGHMSNYNFYPAAMRSHARLTYTQVGEWLMDNKTPEDALHKELLPHLQNLHALYELLQLHRQKRGAIDFSTTETQIIFADDKKIERIVARERNDAHRLIEECMISANIAAADALLKAEMPVLYRIHEGPSSEKLIDLREFLSELGLTLGGGDEPEPRHYVKILDVIKDRPDAHLIQTVLLRSMQQAVYSPDNIGHFGLSLSHYCHFTSPIRRYPDLLVHRALKHLHKAGNKHDYYYNHEQMVNFGETCSMCERRADDATRDATDWLKCEYMMDKIGQEFDGTITSVTSFGLFVELDEIYVEGLVHITSLHNDYYHYDPVKHRLCGERTNSCYRLADKIRVQVVRVDLDDKKIDFALSTEES